MQPLLQPRAGYDRNTFHKIWHIRGVFTYVVYIEINYEKKTPKKLFCLLYVAISWQLAKCLSHLKVRLYQLSDVMQTLSLWMFKDKLETHSQDPRACQEFP